MANSVNGYPVIESDTYGGPQLRRFNIPDKTGKIVAVLPMRDGSAGFLLAHLAAWFNDEIEPLAGKVLDDWGYAYRPIAGTDSYSNHASGTACDLNALQHGRGRHTFSAREFKAIAKRVTSVYDGCIECGSVWSNPDDMHFELSKTFTAVQNRARALLTSPRGKLVTEVNPGLSQFVLS